ncbi:LysR family transcriptional regulator [Streptomyces lincolnensis]|uniref:LysR family transcriptional regulator n=1 Tax=Streptomyces lincolnensis TaxID=1915 RepID=UPI001E29FBC4|nr:LysR family transcriptional regulator [Streptomyces lincolnensis]MCD7437281.1 LysR family transcriptional regulator [Streptomyces lincolnensis]
MSVLDERIGPSPLDHMSSGEVHEDPNHEGVRRAVTHAEHVDDFDMRHLRYFLTVVRAGTVSGAAQELRISQPSLSQQIKRLERRIGAPLFIRSSRGVELTTGGRAFLQEIQGIPGQLRSAIAAAAPSPRIWPVGVCGGVPAEVLAEVQSGLSGQHGERPGGRPAPPLRMRSVSAADQLELLQHGEIAFGIVRLPVTMPGLVRAVVWDEPLGVVMCADHPLAGRPEPTWADLSAQRLLWYDEGCAPGYADTVPAQLAALGWKADLHPVDQDQQALFVHALQTGRDVVALRPRLAVQGDPQLVWRPLPTRSAPRERLAVTALAGSRAARYLSRVAGRCGWSYLG